MNFFYKNLGLVFYYIENKISDFYIKISGLKASAVNIPSYEVDSLRIFQASTIVEKEYILQTAKVLFNEDDPKLINLVYNSPASFILSENGELCGYAVYRIVYPFYIKKIWLYSVGIDSKHQGKGYGFILTKYSLKIMANFYNVKNFFLIVNTSNKAIKLYKKIFFKEYIKIFSSKILMKKVMPLQDFNREYNNGLDTNSDVKE